MVLRGATATRRWTSASSTATTTRIRRHTSTSRISIGPAHDNGKIPNESVRGSRGRRRRKDKVQFWFTNQNKYRPSLRHHREHHARRAPAASAPGTRQPMTLKWTRTQTNRLLLRGRAARQARAISTTATSRDGHDLVRPRDDPEHADLRDHRSGERQELRRLDRPATARSAAINASAAFATTYVTGSHAFKAGIEVGERAERRAQAGTPAT